MERPTKIRKTKNTDEHSWEVRSPVSLYHRCIQYIAQNLHMVDSFYGFPDLVAADIFKESEKCKKFEITSAENDSLKNLQLFCEIYPDSVLSSLNLSASCRALNYWLEHFLVFSGLQSLDVSDCFLGDEHEILSHIAHLKLLKSLNLRKNCLTDKGVSRFCAPFKLFRRGPEHLTVLDVSENGCISNRGIKMLQCFKDLQKVDITGTSVKVKEISSDWKVLPEKGEGLMSIKNEGWASHVVCKWMELATRTHDKDEHKTSKFYAIKKRIKSRINVQNVSKVSFVPQYRLVLHRIHHLKKVTAPCVKIPTLTEQDNNMDAIMNLYKP